MAKIILRGKIWYSDYFANGQRIRKPLSPNRRDAQNMQDELVAAQRYHAHGLIPANASYDSFKNLYLSHRRSSNRPNTWAHDDLAFRRLEELRPIKYLHQITPALLEEAKMRWKKSGYGASAVGSYVMRIKVAMKTAENWGYSRPQIWRVVKDYVSPGRVIAYSMEQYELCLSKCVKPYDTALRLMARAGLRSGEVRFLEWSDINFKESTLFIHPKPFWKPKGWTPQKDHSRFVDLSPDLESHLKDLPDKSGFIVGGTRAISASRYSAYFKDLINRMGMRGSAHCFRHSFVSWLLENGATLDQIGPIIGHTNPATTKMYAHLSPHARRQVIAKLPVTDL